MTAILVAAGGASSAENRPPTDSLPPAFDWSKLPSLPDKHGFAGPFAGMSNGALLVAGGANFPERKPWEGGRKQWHDTIFLLPANGSNWIAAGRLPHVRAYGISITTPDGVLCIGGDNSEQTFADAFLMKRDGDGVSFTNYPPLPASRTNAAGALLNNKVYVFGGIDQSSATTARNDSWVLDLKMTEDGWTPLEPFPGPARMLATAAAVGNEVYVCSGASLSAGPHGKPVRTYLRDAWQYKPGRGWKRIADLPRAAVAAPSPAPAIEPAEFFLLGGDDGSLAGRPASPDHPGFAKSILRYHALTDTWSEFPDAEVASVTVPAVPDGRRFILPSGEIRPGIRTPEVSVFAFTSRKPAFGVLNWSSLALYLLFILGIGVYCGRGNENADDFFRGGQRIPWWAAGLSIFATTLSSITYMAVPAKAYAENWVFALANLPILLLAPFIVYIILPVFRRIDATSAYEYLERRFNLAVRLFGAASFSLLQVGRMAIVLFLPALALAAVTDLNVRTCILLMGVITIIYCVLGGITAVIWTDVAQSVILLAGAVIALVLIVMRIPDGYAGFVREAADHGKFQLVNRTWDYTVAALWVVLLGNMFSNLIPYTSDQAVVQRYMTTCDEKAAARSIWLNACVALPATAIFFLVGTALFVYYRHFPGHIGVGIKTDSVFPMFIARELPPGMGGVIIAGIFAAAQSTISTSMNSLSTVLVVDFYKRLGGRISSGRQELLLARWITALLGVIGTGAALLLTAMDIRSLWDTFLQLLGLAGGALAGLFMLGIFSTRANGGGAMIGAAVSVVVLYFVQRHTSMHFFLYAPVGICTSVIVGYAASLLFGPPAAESIRGLTFASIREGVVSDSGSRHAGMNAQADPTA